MEMKFGLIGKTELYPKYPKNLLLEENEMKRILKKAGAVMIAAVIAVVMSVLAGAEDGVMTTPKECGHTSMTGYQGGPYYYEYIGTHQHVTTTTQPIYTCVMKKKYATIRQVCNSCGYVYSTFISSVGIVHERV